MKHWLKNLRQNSIKLGAYLEDLHPDLARHFMGYASEVVEPHAVGMGLKLEEWSDERLSLRLPGRWRNRNAQGRISLGALGSATEVGLRLFWSRHLEAFGGQLQIQEMHLRWLPLAQYHHQEDLLLKIEARALGVNELFLGTPESSSQAPLLWTLSWLNLRSQQVAEVEVQALIELLPALPPKPESDTSS